MVPMKFALRITAQAVTVVSFAALGFYSKRSREKNVIFDAKMGILRSQNCRFCEIVKQNSVFGLKKLK